MHLVDRPLIIWNVSDTATMRELPFLTGTSTGTINTLTLPYPSTQKAQLKRKDSNKRTDRTCINRHIHTYRHTAGTNREHIQWDWCRQPSERRRITVHQFTKKKKKKEKNDQHDDFRDVFTLRFDSLHFSKVPADRNPSQNPARSALAVDRKLISSVFFVFFLSLSRWEKWSVKWSKLCIKSNIRLGGGIGGGAAAQLSRCHAKKPKKQKKKKKKKKSQTVLVEFLISQLDKKQKKNKTCSEHTPA